MAIFGSMMGDTAQQPATVQATVIRLVEPVVESLGLAVWGVEVTQSHRPVIRLFVEGSDGTSATIDQCEEISRHLSLALDVEEGLGLSLPEAYVLEVSTPGLSRLFFTLKQMAPFVGDFVDVRLHVMKDMRKTWRGVLKAVEGDSLTLQPARLTEDDEIVPENCEPVQLAWGDVRRASRVAVFPKPVKPGKGPGKKSKKPSLEGEQTVGSCHES